MTEQKNTKDFPLGKENFKLIAVGFIILIIGFIILSGGRSPDPNVFSTKIFDFRRLILAPLVILFGFLFEIYAIMKKSK